MSEEKRNVKWTTSIMELPEDTSFEGCRHRLNNPNNYESDKLFAYDCWQIATHALNNNKYVDDVMEMYDILLENGVPENVEADICCSLGEMAHYIPELKPSIVEIGVKHSPLFEKNIENQDHLYTEEIKDMQCTVSEVLSQKNNEIMDGLKAKMQTNDSKKEVASTEIDRSTKACINQMRSVNQR